jgi:inner membrane protein
MAASRAVVTVMDNLTHTLTAVTLSHAGLNRKTRFATLALVVGANLPDIDVAWSFGGSARYLQYHRGVTHSLLGVTILAAALATALYGLGRRAAPKKNVPPINGRWLFGTCLAATATHLLMDYTNAYGIRPFLPFSGRWYAWDIAPIVDLVLLAVLVAGWALPALFRLVSEEVGAGKPSSRRGAIVSLACVVLLWGLRDSSHRRVLGQMDSHNYGDELPLRLGAFPTTGNPFRWTGVAETDSAFHLLSASALDDDVDVEHAELFRKPAPSAALDAAKRTRTGATFYDFARFPWAEVVETDEGFEVTVRDLRFAAPDSERRGFEIRIRLDKNLHALSESFHF